VTNIKLNQSTKRKQKNINKYNHSRGNSKHMQNLKCKSIKAFTDFKTADGKACHDTWEILYVTTYIHS